MEIRHLKLVVEVSKQGSLTKASETLFVSQSALSHQLKELESELGIVIFNRVNNRLELTNSGEVFRQYAQKIIQQLTELENAVKHGSEGRLIKIRFTQEAYTSYQWITEILKEVNKLYPSAEVNLITESPKKPLKLLRDGKTDFALMVFEPFDSMYDSVPLFKDELVLIINRNNPIATADWIDTNLINTQTVITHAGPDERHMIFEKAGLFKDLEPKKFIQMEFTEAAIDMVKNDLGVAIMSKWAVQSYLNEALKIIRITKTGIYRNWHLVSLKHSELSEPHIKFKSLVIEALSEK
ncbi:LysR family transcriptional regulator [Fulvivirga lutea]|uniref:LysR family transcriptional regulator n=1 Tax=Fulvivirga lutea TaxID=2810512 RepID=A0A975A275_9BACT|nr:LysR family transcriptional regulator [Fulvivirga lutea]QSE99141.1 LysR family transcriptional regulator [Fulvivirga lutea]